MVEFVDSNSEMAALRAAIRHRMADLARFLCGVPNRRMSNRRELRFGQHGSLSIVVTGPKVGTWYDHEAGEGGDAFDLISQRLGLNFPRAKEWAIRFVGGGVPFPAEDQPMPILAAANDNTEVAQRIWNDSAEPRGTIVEAYLSSRKLRIPAEIAGTVIRFHGALPHEGRRVSGMVALMRDLRSNEPCGIHRTFLTPQGAKLEKRMLGRAKGAAIKLSPDEDVTLGLHVGEGIESTLSFMMAGYAPAWALGSAGAIAAFPVLPGIEALTIFTENDKASECAADVCADRWLEADREVTFATPQYGDGNDILKEVAA